MRLVESHGIDGDAKGGSGERQLNVMLAEALAELGPRGSRPVRARWASRSSSRASMATLTPVRLALGESAVIEVTLPRTGCDRFEMIQGKPKEIAKGRLGVMARVVAGGAIRST